MIDRISYYITNSMGSMHSGHHFNWLSLMMKSVNGEAMIGTQASFKHYDTML